MPTRQSQKTAESERCTVSIEGLSSSTTDLQLQNLLRSIGPIKVGTKYITLENIYIVFSYLVDMAWLKLNLCIVFTLKPHTSHR